MSNVYRALWRLAAAPGMTDGGHADDGALPPISDEMWAAWARQAPNEPGTILPTEEAEILWLGHALTKYPCRMGDGRMGQVAVLEVDGEWMVVCREPTD